MAQLRCGSISVHDTNACAVAGVLSAGADCITLLSGTKSSITFEELVEMLEPTSTRGGAIIVPLEDYVQLKTELEQACQYVRCNKATKKKLKTVLDNLNSLLPPQ